MVARSFAVCALVAAVVSLAACGGSPSSKWLKCNEQVAARGEELVEALRAVPSGDAAAAKAACPKIEKLYDQLAEAIRERAEAAWLAGSLSLSVDERVRQAKVLERIQAFGAALPAALGRLSPAQQAALATAELQVADARCRRWAEDPWYLQSYEALGECEDLQRLGKPCEWAEAMVRLGSAITAEALANDIRRVHAEGYESATWEQMAGNSTDMLLLTSAMRDKLYRRIEMMRVLFKPNASATTWEDWLSVVKRDCRDNFERMKVSDLRLGK
jgi:hypothetical protein